MEPTNENAAGASAPQSAPVANLEARIRNGAGWFYWMAAFSVINSVLVYTKAAFSFGLGLAVTVYRDDIARQVGGPTMTKHIAINVAIAAFIATFSYFAGKRHGWAFIVGMILLGLDTVLAGLLDMWLNLAFHIWAMVSLFLGYRTLRAAGR